MKRFAYAMCLAGVFGMAGVGAAQYPPQSPADQKPKADKADTVTVTGCVADKDAASGHFILNDATTSSAGAAAGAGATGTSGTTASSFELQGGGDLKAHVGHKVEITGTVEEAKAGTSGANPPSANPPAGNPPASAMSSPKSILKVKNVKMVSETCK